MNVRQLQAEYNLDEASNLTGMPRKPGDRLDDFDVEHRGSHPRYTDAVKRELNDTTDRLKERYNTDSLDGIPAGVIKKEMQRIENEFRRRIETNKVPMKNGKLAFLPSQPSSLGGHYEIRV